MSKNKHLENARDLHKDIMETKIGEVIDFKGNDKIMRFKRIK